MSPYKRLLTHLQRIFKPSDAAPPQAVHPQTALHIEDIPAPHQPRVITRNEHTVSRKNISRNAVKVLYTLNKAGYQAFIVGGGVRDLLLNLRPKDFDIATNAHPDEVRTLFRNCRLIGRRFRLAHVHFGEEIIEVATFRALHHPDADNNSHSGARVIEKNGMVLRDNVYGSFEEDAVRRDFTINALYYNIADFSVIDFHHGMEDLNAGLVRLIGDPIQRYHEDPVRMLRAVRFSAKLGFRIEAHTEAPLLSLGNLLQSIPPSRLFDEVQKLFLTGHAEASLHQLERYDLFHYLFPYTQTSLANNPLARPFLVLVCRNTDERIAQHKPVTAAFLCAALLWYPFLELSKRYHHDEEMGEAESQHQAGHEIFRLQGDTIAIPKRLGMIVRDIWQLQARMTRIKSKRVLKLIHHPSFRAAYDFLLLRAAYESDLVELAQWWQQFYHADEPARNNLIEPTPPSTKRRRRRKKISAPE
jgi:poly(A) polymerase